LYGCSVSQSAKDFQRACSSGKPRRKKLLKAYNVLGDMDEYESMLQAVEKPRTSTPEPATFDISIVPQDVMDAMKLDESVYHPMLEAFEELFNEKQALQQEYERVTTLEAEDSRKFMEESLTCSADTRDSR
jgi:hypothetical protein